MKPPLNEPERALCALTAAWLDAQRTLSMLPVLACSVAIAHLFFDRAMPGIAATVLLMALPERYFALRIAFDAGVFRALALGPVRDTDAFDQALRQLDLGGGTAVDRSIVVRTQGAMRLWRRHLAVSLLQFVLMILLLALIGR